MARKRTRPSGRLYRKRDRWYADFSDYRDVGGRLEALVPPGARPRRATTDRDVASVLLARRLAELETARKEGRPARAARTRRAVLTGGAVSDGAAAEAEDEPDASLAAYARHHLVEKKRSRRVTDGQIANAEHALRRAVGYFGADRPLVGIAVRDVQDWTAALAALPGRRGAHLSPQTVRHHLNALSNLYRRAISEGRVPVGYNPVGSMMDKPVPSRREAKWLEVHDAALLLESARTCDAAPPPLAATLLALGRAGWTGAAADLLALLDARRPAPRGQRIAGGWPSTLRGLTGALTQALPLLRANGVTVVRAAGAVTLHGCEPVVADEPPATRMLSFVYPLLATFLLTGGRRGEVLGLHVEDVSFERQTVTFRPRAGHRLKTRNAARVVPLWPQLAEILGEYLYGGATPRVEGLLFPGAVEGAAVVEPRYALDRVAERAGWEPGDVRFYALRHTYCAARLQTLDAGAPVSPWTVAREMGHGGRSLVDRIYGHLGTVRHRAEVVEYRADQHAEKLGQRLDVLHMGSKTTDTE